jgi:hypothetical protein
MLFYLVLPSVLYFWFCSSGFHALSAWGYALCTLAWFLAVCLFDTSYKRDGKKWPAFQNLRIWVSLASYFNAGITTQTELNDDQQYIFCAFPHGACTVQHILTMTNGCGMLSTVHKGDRRDLAASILFFIPFVRDLLLWLGNVDASSKTAHYNLKKGRSLLIFIGGEREQLLTCPGKHSIFLSERKGFIKLALEYGIPLVPMVSIW